MSSNDVLGKINKTTHKQVSSNWRHVSKFQLEINDETWPELPSLGTKTLNKKMYVPKTHVSKLCSVVNMDKLSESHKSFPVDPAQVNTGTTRHSCECEVTPNDINHTDAMMSGIFVKCTSGKSKNSFVANIDSNFSGTQDNNDLVVTPKRSFGKICQQIIDSNLKEDYNQSVDKKIDTGGASLYENNFQNDFPTLDANKKKVGLKSGQLYKHCNDSCKPSLSNNTKKPKAKDPICISILDVISTLPIKPKGVRGKLETGVLSKQLVGIIKPLQKRMYASAHTYGNPLDSDKPLRKRGKVRPNKKFKPSLLKAVILKTREDKLKAKQTAKKRLLDSKTILLNDVAHSLQMNVVNLNGKNVKDLFINGKEKDGNDQYADIHNEGKTPTPLLLHTQKFREYCNNCLTTELVQNVSLLVETVVRYQDRQYARDPIKAHAKRRYVVGLREARKYLKMKRIRLLIIAPDLEHVPGKGGLDDTIQQLKSDAEIQHIPYLFGPSRRQLGKSSHKNVLVSCIAILNYEGAEDLVSKVLEHLLEARKKYSVLTYTSGYCNITSPKNENNTGKEESVDTEVIVSLLQKLTCSGSNVNQKDAVDEGKHSISSPFLAALENIL